MRIPIGKSYQASLDGQVKAAYRCKLCLYEEPVLVESRGTGGGVSPLWMENAAAQRRAFEEAQATLVKNARRLLTFVPCPRCQWRNPLGRAVFWGKTAAKGALLFLSCWGAGELMSIHEKSSVMPTVCTLWGLAGCIFCYFVAIRWIRAEAEARVKFQGRSVARKEDPQRR